MPDSQPSPTARHLAELADLAARAVALQATAEVVIQGCRLSRRSAPASLLAEGNQVLERYRALREELLVLARGGPLETELGELLDEHVRVIAQALRVASTSGGAGRAGRARLGGLGPAAGHLVALRDQLRRAEPVARRAVNDVPTRNRL
jgi:hypothetical protein